MAISLATVEALQEALNAYDSDAAVALIADGGTWNGATPGNPNWEKILAEWEAWGKQGTLSDCVVTDGVLTCLETWERTKFGSQGGIIRVSEWEFRFDDQGLIRSAYREHNVSGGPESIAVDRALGAWMATAHPEAYETFYIQGNVNEEACMNGIDELMPLIDEFVAQSDDYPLRKTADQNVFAVTFHGSKCTTEDLPSELPAGNYTFVLTNLDDDKTGDFGMRKYIGEKAGITEAEVNALIEEMGGDGAYPLGSYDWLEGAVIDFHAERLELEPNQDQYDFILEPGSYWMRSNTTGPNAHWHCGVVIVTAP